MEIRRGDIFWVARFREDEGHMNTPGRPAIIVSNDANNECSGTVEIVYLTTRPKKHLPTHCAINSAIYPSTALCEQVHTINTDVLTEFVGRCTDQEMDKVEGCIAISLGLTPQKAPGAKHDGNEPLIDRILALEKELAAAKGREQATKELYRELLTAVTN